MNRIIISLLLLLLPLTLAAQSTGAELIDASIKYHDPENSWPTAALILGFNDTRPGKANRQAGFSFNNSTGVACVTREMDGHKITWHVVNDDCRFEIDGRFEPTEEEIKQYNLTKERALMMRNYYLYLWGLPMKLKDPGTLIDPEIQEKSFNGQLTKAVKITYEEDIGSDIWYFYFAPDSNELIGYQFYHDEEKGDGEYITLSGMEEVDGMRIPKSRSWYINADSTLLGTDHLIFSHSNHRHN
jgi:hypothetical protein